MPSTIRVIPTLLLKEWGIVKTVRFQEETYIGCPINAVRVFNANNVDELILLDIQATQLGRIPLADVVSQIADEALMPITVGGGLQKMEHIRELLRIGADKVTINTAACENPAFIEEAAGKFGSQCIVVSIDVKQVRDGSHEVFCRRGSTATGLDPVSHAVRMQELGAGEILLNSIDQDGTWDGYELGLLRQVCDAVTIPVIACGGAGELQHFSDAVTIGHASAVSAGSFFLYHTKRRGILINFPTREELQCALGETSVRGVL
ncbi:MAG: imidazole glycerol phosphate synthase subunit HisF [Planctomycetes bacterium]|nr:imidazole glycerol phosphate synthase subunit HisF [Planctomycetota bacterium]